MKKLLALIFLVGCGKDAVMPSDFVFFPRREFTVTREPELEPYLRTFEEVVGRSTQHVSTSFAQLPFPSVGMCYLWSDGGRTIEIDPAFWALAPDTEKEALVWHEAGHCAMDLDHTEELIELDGVPRPRSLMYPHIFGAEDYYIKHRDYYHTELRERR